MGRWIRPMPDDWKHTGWPPPLTGEWWGITGFIVAVSLVVVGGVTYEALQEGVTGSPGGPNAPAYVAPAAVDDSDVTDVCHQQVLDLLKAPSTAKFSGDRVQPVNGNTWSDFGLVDSENSYSAMIRNSYTCTAIHKGGLNWSVRVTGIQ